MTDVLATTSGPLTDFLVNDKTLRVFSEFNLMRHQVFDVTVISSLFFWIINVPSSLRLNMEFQMWARLELSLLITTWS